VGFNNFMHGFVGFIDSVIDASFSKECRWCGKHIRYDSKQKTKLDRFNFCSLKCGLKYANEMEDLKDRSKSAGNSRNYNYNDRNKYLKED